MQDNWALLYSQQRALQLNVPLHVVVCVPPEHGEMTGRHYTFMLEGLREVARECAELNISFHLAPGHPPDILTPAFLAAHELGLLVADFSPLRAHRAWLDTIVKNLSSAAVSGTLGGGVTEKVSTMRSGYSSRASERSRVPMPGPVPPPRKWHSWRPWRRS